jgi:hypothetical protein
MEISKALNEDTNSKVKETPAADLVMSILLMGLAATVGYIAWSWPRPEGISSAPGLFPFLISSSLGLMALGLFINALRLKGYRQLLQVLGKTYLRNAWNRGNMKLALLTLATVLTYMIVILNILPFEIGTFLYMAGALYLYWRGNIYKILIISAVMVGFYSLSFKILFRLVLPGVEM